MFLDYCVRPKSFISHCYCLAMRRGFAGVFLACFLLALSRTSSAQTLLVPVWMSSTISGDGTNKDTGEGGPASSAEQSLPEDIAMDQAGNLYISDNGTYVIRKVSPNGVITTVAGTEGTSGHTGDGGLATQATLHPFAIAVDRNGNLLIVDQADFCVRKVDVTSGIITTFAGTCGTQHSYLGDGGAATSALMSSLYGVYADRLGNVYISDAGNHVIRKVDVNGIITTFAGNGTSGGTGDGGPAINAKLNLPFHLWVDPANNLYICDYGTNTVRMVDTNGMIKTVAGNGTLGYTGDGGQATNAELDGPHRIVGDGLGNFYIADDHNYLVRMVDPSGSISSIAGIYNKMTYVGTDIPATTTGVNPYGIAIDSSNNLYIADPSQYRIHRLSFNTGLPTTSVSSTAIQNLAVESTAAITPNAAILTPSTPAEFTLGTLSGCALGASLAANTPCTIPITFSPTAPGLQTAQLAITDLTGKVSIIGLSGVGVAPQLTFSGAAISTVAGDGTAGSGATQVNAPRGGVVDSAGNIYFADSGNNIIRRIDHTSGLLSTVAGNGSAGYTGDGTAATAAQLNAPAKVVLDAAGDLYIADTGNSVIRYVDASTGNISTIAGTGTAGYSGDAGQAAAAELNHPQGLFVDLGSHVYVADTGNNVIRYFGKGGLIVTLSGTGTAGYAGDGGLAFGAAFNAPQSVLVDLKGNVYIADTGNNVIRMIAAQSQIISTVAGTAGASTNAGDGGIATSATLDLPSDIALDVAGDLYIAAAGQVRMVNPAGTITTVAGISASGNSYSGEGGSAASAVLPAPVSNLMLDSAANLFLADTAANRVLKVAAATPVALDLGTVTPGTTGVSRTISLLNTGNGALNLSDIVLSNDFIQQTSGSTDCTNTTSLAPGQNCTVSIAFSPAAADIGSIAGTLTIADNALNGVVSQTVPLSGTAKFVVATTTVVSISPASPVYGSPATVTATVSDGSTPTGTVSFSVNGSSIGTAPFNNNQATLQLPVLPAGTVTVLASYSGDSNNAASSGTASPKIQPAVLSVTATDATIPFGDSLPTFIYTITGFVNRDTQSVVSGTPSETTAASSSSAGKYPISITQGTLAAANYTFAFVNGTLTIQPPLPPDYTFSATPSATSVPAGSVAYVTLALVPLHGYMGTVNLSCAGLPKGASCAFTSPLKGDGLGDTAWTQVMISTNGSQAIASASRRPGNAGGVWLTIGAPLCFLGIALRRRRWIGRLLLLTVTTITAVGVTSCSQGTAGPVVGQGTYLVVVTAADTSANLSHATTFALTIQ
jgi:sugar lactone lactonase YvrE